MTRWFHAHTRRSAARGLTLALALSSGLAIAATESVAQPTTAQLSQPDDPRAAAMGLAKRTGQRVEVATLRTETTREFADPSGSWVHESYFEPVRINKDGHWRDVDDTLAQNGDGSWSPRVSKVDASVSNGGSGPFLTVREGEISWSLSWPDPLPAPAVSGASAVFTEVLPGVDLVVHATSSGVGESLVVKSKEASKHPRVRSIEMKTSVTGGHVVAKAEGGFDVVDNGGLVRLTSPRPTMWDSTGAQLSSTAEEVTSADLAPGGSHARRAFDGDREKALQQEAGSGRLRLVPDPAVLDAPTTRYPVVIDPTTSPKTGPSRWAMVNKTYPTTPYYNWRDEDEGVGYNSYQGVNIKRQFWMFNTAFAAGSTVSSAVFYAWETFSANCNSGTVNAYLTSDISSTSPPTWNAQPARSGSAVDSWSGKAGQPNCYSGGRLADWNIKTAVQTRATEGKTYTTISLAGSLENTNDSWMRFAGPLYPTVSRRPYVQVVYNRQPSAPLATEMSTPNATKLCATSASAPTVINPFIRVDNTDGTTTWTTNTSTRFYAKGRDPDGDSVTTAFYLYTASGTYLGYEIASANAASGAQVSVSVADTVNATAGPSASLVDGQTFYWKARSNDGGPWASFSPLCYVKIDRAAPPPPTVTSTSLTSGELAAATTTKATFSLAATGATQFKYWFNGASGSALTTTSSTLTDLAIPAGGSNVLFVAALDAVGNTSTPSEFWIRRAVGEKLASYSFNPPIAADQMRAASKVGPFSTGTPPEVQSDPSLDLTATSTVGSPLVWAKGLDLQAARSDVTTGTLGGAGSCFTPTAQSFCALAFDETAPEARSVDTPVFTDLAFTTGTWAWLGDATQDASLLAVTKNPPPASGDPTGTPHVLDIGWNATTARFTATLLLTNGSTVTASDLLDAGVTSHAGRWVYLQIVSTGTSLRLDSAVLNPDPACIPGDPCPGVLATRPGAAVAMPAGVAPQRATGVLRVGTGPTGNWTGGVDGLSFWQQALSGSGTPNDLSANALLQP